MRAKKPQGRHPDKRLTAVRIRTLKMAGRYADGHGLYLFVDASGAKRWVWRGRIAANGHKRSDLGLGSVKSVTLAEARDKAIGLRRQVRDGMNPRAARRRERRTVPTFKYAASQFHAAHSATFKNAKHKAQWLASLEADVFPAFGDRPVNAIDSADVLKVLSAVWTTKPETARRLKQRSKVVFDWAKASAFCSGDNPTDGLTKVLPKHRGEVLIAQSAARRVQPVPDHVARAAPHQDRKL